MTPMAMALVALRAGLQAAAAAQPFHVGERFEYNAKFGMLSVGDAAIEVVSIDTVRAEPAYYFKYSLNASALVFKIQSSLESWTSLRDFRTLRFRQDSKENSRRYLRDYDVFADSGYYRQHHATATTPTVAEPLDDASIVFYLRSMPLEVGQTYEFKRHFKPEHNPILIKVLKKEMMELPGGVKVNCWVLNPVVGDKMFAKKANARVWLTDDARRVPVQIRSQMDFGTIVLRLEKMSPAPASSF
ncbi:MAG: DUF3108 domain-containing protein [Gemmatimonadales bacterium]|nr:DUF3108 domain-containing protein [Gemmatimonadales bacterium]